MGPQGLPGAWRHFRISMISMEKKWPRREAQLLPDMSRAIFQQDSAPAHRARKTREWCRSHFPECWRRDESPILGRGESPGNSPRTVTDNSPVQDAAAAAALMAKVAELNDPTITAKWFQSCGAIYLVVLAVAAEQPQENFDINGTRHTN